MALTVLSPAGERVQLTPQPFAQGGEACVYEIPAFQNAVVKLYHPEILAKRGDALRQKIDAMSTDPKLLPLIQNPQLAWPRFSVRNEQGQWLGYAMRRVQGQPLIKMAHAMAYREHWPALGRVAVVNYLLSLFSTLQQLQQAGVMLGDYNPSNFLCDTSSYQVTCIDCDSWQVRAQGQLFACPVSVADMLPPELLDKNLAQVHRTERTEAFAIAILLFKTLMLGRHPYDVVGGDGPVQNIRRGYFPYGLGGGGIPKGPWFNIWSHLPFSLKEQFVATFKQGAHQPQHRTTLAQWLELLALYRKELGKGWHDAALRPLQPKSRDYRGQQAQAMRSSTA